LKIYTRRGDAGETDLLGGGRVGKEHRRVEAYGAVDELNACLGVAAAASAHADLRELVRGLQSALFDLGAYLASPDTGRRERAGLPEPADEDVSALERRIDALEAELEPLRRFILPGGSASRAPSAAAPSAARSSSTARIPSRRSRCAT